MYVNDLIEEYLMNPTKENYALMIKALLNITVYSVNPQMADNVYLDEKGNKWIFVYTSKDEYLTKEYMEFDEFRFDHLANFSIYEHDGISGIIVNPRTHKLFLDLNQLAVLAEIIGSHINEDEYCS